MIPKELEEIIEEYDENDYSVYITRADYENNNCFTLDFVVEVQNINEKGFIFQKWSIEAIGYKKAQISFERSDILSVSEDHPLVWEFTDIQSELYFTGEIKEPAILFFDLYKTHKKLFKNYQSLYLPFSEDKLYSKKVPYGNGFLAKGPKRVLELYADCVKRNGLEFSIIGEIQPSYWNGYENVRENQDLNVLLLGDTYIIAEKFLFKRQD